MKKILITGFDPFGQEPINPAYEAVKLLPDMIEGVEIIKLEIPTVSNKAAEKTIQAMNEHDVDVVINVGQAGGRYMVTPEKVAINLNEFRIKDNEGNQLLGEEIIAGAPAAYFTTLPVKAMVKEIKEAKLPAAVSYTAGTFVCNQVMFEVAHYINTNDLAIKSGFIHIPYMTEQVLEKPNQPSLSLIDLAKALEQSLLAVVKYDEEIDAVSGYVS